MEGAYPHTDPQTSFSQCPPVLEGLINSLAPDTSILSFPQNFQVPGEYQGFPFIRPSDSMYQMTFPCFTPSTLKSDGYRVGADEDIALADVDASRDSCTGHMMSMNTSSDHGQSRHQYTPFDTARNSSASPKFPTTSRTSIAVQSQQQSASRDELRLRRSHISRNGHAATTSRSYRPRTGKRGAPKRLYPCHICDKAYSQPQGVTRHHREAHQVSVCNYCGNFRWGRPYQLRKHFKEQHPDVDPDTVLRGRRKATQIHKLSSQQPVSTHDYDRRGPDEPHLWPQAPLPSDEADFTLLSPPPVMSSLDYFPLPKPVEPMMNTTQADEDPCDLLLDATYTGAAVSSNYEFVRHANNFETASQSEPIWYRNEEQSACQDESATASSQSKPFHPYRLLTDFMAAPSSSFLWSKLLDPRILLHSPMQSMIDPASLSPRGRLPRRH